MSMGIARGDDGPLAGFGLPAPPLRPGRSPRCAGSGQTLGHGCATVDDEPRGSIPQTSPSARPHGPVASAAGATHPAAGETFGPIRQRARRVGRTEGVARVEVGIWAWVGFVGLIVFLLALDLFVFHRDAHEV